MPFLSELHTGKITDALNAIFDKRDTLNPVLITNAHRWGEMGFQILNQIQTQLNFGIICECQLFFVLFVCFLKRFFLFKLYAVADMTPDDDQIVELKRGEEITVSAYAVNISNLEDISHLWESTIVKEKTFMNQQEETCAHNMAAEAISVDDEESRTNQKRKRKETEELTEQQSQEGGSGGDDRPVGKKPRVVWTKEMHRKFLEAIEILGPDSKFSRFLFVFAYDLSKYSVNFCFFFCC